MFSNLNSNTTLYFEWETEKSYQKFIQKIEKSATQQGIKGNWNIESLQFQFVIIFMNVFKKAH